MDVVVHAACPALPCPAACLLTTSRVCIHVCVQLLKNLPPLGGLGSLVELVLSHNQLTAFSAQEFAPVPGLLSLFVNHNKLATVRACQFVNGLLVWCL